MPVRSFLAVDTVPPHEAIAQFTVFEPLTDLACEPIDVSGRLDAPADAPAPGIWNTRDARRSPGNVDRPQRVPEPAAGA